MPHKGKGKKSSKGKQTQAAKGMSAVSKSDGSKEAKEKTPGATCSTEKTVASPFSGASSSQESTMKPANTKSTVASPSKTEPAKTEQSSKPADSPTKATVGEKAKEPSMPADPQTKAAAEMKPKEPSLPKDSPSKTAPATKPQEPSKTAPATKPQEPSKTAPATKPQEPSKTAPATKPQEPSKTAPAAKPQEPSKTAPAAKPQELGKMVPAAKPQEPSKMAPAAKPQEPSKTAPAAKPQEPSKTTPATKPQEPSKMTPATKPKEPSKTTPATKPQEPSKTAPATKPLEPTGTKVSPPATEKNKANETTGAKETGKKPTQTSSKAGAKMSDDALDELMGTLAPDEPLPEFPEFTGPTVDENKSKSVHVDKLGERDDTLPPEYRKLLEKGSTPGKSAAAEPADEKVPKKPKTLPSDSEAIDILCEGFDSSPLPPEKKAKTEQPPFESDPIDELTLGFETVSSQKSAPQQSVPGKPKTEKMPLDALDVLAGSLEPQELPESPKFTGPEVHENKYKSEHVSKLGERDDTLPPEYRKLLEKETTDGKGAPAGKAEEKPKSPKKSMSDKEAIDVLSGDFVGPPVTSPQTKAQPGSKTPASSKAAADKVSSEVISATSAAPVQSAAVPPSPQMSDKALDDLIGSLDTPVPESPKFTGPAVDEKKSKEKHIDKLGERDDTIPEEYRKLLDKDSKGSPTKKKEEKHGTPKKSMSDKEAIDTLSGDFVDSPVTSPQTKAQPGSKTPASSKAAADKVSSEVISATSAAPVQSAAVPPSPQMSDKALDDLVGSLDTPAPESPKFTGPAVDEKKSKEKHIDKLGERDDTIPEDYRKLLEKDITDKGSPTKKKEEKPGTPKKSISEKDAIDALSGDFVSSPTSTPQSKAQPGSQKSGSTTSTPAPKSSEMITASSAGKVAAPPPSKPGSAKSSPAPPSSDVITASTASKVTAPLPPRVSKEATLDSLADTLPKQSKDKPAPAEDKVKEKHGSDHKDKLGEREDTIVPDYRFIEDSKHKGQPADKGKPPSKSPGDDREAIDALSSDFISPTSAPKVQSAVSSHPSQKPAGTASASETITCSSASKVAAPPAKNAKDAVLDSLGDTLPKQSKDKPTPAVDKVKEKHDSEHLDKRGEREDTIPEEYRFIEGEKGKSHPTKPAAKGKDTAQAAKDDEAAIDALAGGFLTDESAKTKSKETAKTDSQKSKS